VRALLIAVLALALAAPAASAQDPVDRAAEALRSDPVYVDPDAERAITAQQADELRAAIGDADIHVAILPAAAGDPDEVAPALAEAAGEPGSYGVVVGDSFRGGPGRDAGDAADDALAAHGSESTQAVLMDFVDRVEEDGGGGGGAGALIALGVVGAGGAALLVARRRKRQREAAEFAEVKDNARDDLVALGDDVRALEIDVDMPGANPEAREDYAKAVECYDRADQRWRLAREPADLEPVGAALEEGRWAMACARARLESREPPERRPPCFFDPRHGPSDRDVEWAPEYGEPRMVPACEADAQRVEHGDEPNAREMLVDGERVPYWNAGRAYAPFAGGYFGTDLFAGMMIGTMLADPPSFDGGDWSGGDWGGGDFGGGDFGGGDFGGG
jgi:hypothetical protein